MNRIALVVLLTLAANANADWAITEDQSVAWTQNSDGVLTYACVDGVTCGFLLYQDDVSCEEDAEYPLLLSLSGNKEVTGVHHVVGVCISSEPDEDGDYGMVLKLPDGELVGASGVMTSNRLSVAMAMEDHQYRAFRFDLNGSKDAIQHVFSRAKKNNSSNTF